MLDMVAVDVSAASAAPRQGWFSVLHAGQYPGAEGL